MSIAENFSFFYFVALGVYSLQLSDLPVSKPISKTGNILTTLYAWLICIIYRTLIHMRTSTGCFGGKDEASDVKLKIRNTRHYLSFTLCRVASCK